MTFWNYVIPDGSTTIKLTAYQRPWFWNYVIPDGSTTRTAGPHKPGGFWNYVIPDGSTTCNFGGLNLLCFGTMSFQMVLLLVAVSAFPGVRFGTMSFQMVLLQRTA